MLNAAAAVALIAGTVTTGSAQNDQPIQANIFAAASDALKATVPLLANKEYDGAIAKLDPVIAAFEKPQPMYKGRELICHLTTPEQEFYDRQPRKLTRNRIYIGRDLCDLLYRKEFILVEAKRYDQALPIIEKLVAMAPSHALYLNEWGFVLQRQEKWQPSYDAYARANGAADLALEQFRGRERGRALRGMGFALVELRRWDEAKAMYDRALQLNPNDADAKSELDYIARSRRSGG